QPTGNEEFPTIAEYGKERVRRVIANLKKGEQSTLKFESASQPEDLGFRVFKLDTSNIQPWDPDPDHVRRSLLESADHVKPDRSDADVLFEVLLKLGLELTVPIEAKTIAGKEVHGIG